MENEKSKAVLFEEMIRERRKDVLEELAGATDLDSVQTIRTKYLGRKGIVTRLLRSLGELPAESRPQVGQLLNRIKGEMATAIDERNAAIEAGELEALEGEGAWIDITAPGVGSPRGHLHPITLVSRELESIFLSLGFHILDGPEIESEYYNFEALNIPADHPARDMQDTFWLENGYLLRTHTSPVQIRAMERLKPPFKAIVPGRCFRYEATDASHENTFYQVEGLMIDREISVAHLIYFMKTLLRLVFQREVKIRLRPGYFPFVEPGFELDMSCLICGGKGCSVCKKSGWLEVLPCGLVHPNVLRAGGIDPAHYSGFAFGLGLNRLAQMLHGVDDTRLYQGADLRFFEQF